MFYATFKDIGETDIAAFETEKERDDFVDFQDTYSKSIGRTVDNCTFERIALDTEQAEKRIGSMIHTIDDFDSKTHWYIQNSR